MRHLWLISFKIDRESPRETIPCVTSMFILLPSVLSNLRPAKLVTEPSDNVQTFIPNAYRSTDDGTVYSNN